MKPPPRTAIRRAFAATIRSLRSRTGKSQEAVAFEASIDRGYMGGLERGQHSPTLETIYKLLPVLGVDFAQFATEFDKAVIRERRRRNSAE